MIKFILPLFFSTLLFAGDFSKSGFGKSAAEINAILNSVEISEALKLDRIHQIRFIGVDGTGLVYEVDSETCTLNVQVRSKPKMVALPIGICH